VLNTFSEEGFCQTGFHPEFGKYEFHLSRVDDVDAAYCTASSELPTKNGTYTPLW
jgi:hypothetical protein